MDLMQAMLDCFMTSTFVIVCPLDAEDNTKTALMESFKKLLLARLINRQDVVYRGFGRRSP